MSIRTRALIFSTFFGSVIAIGLLLVSLTTEHWVHAYPRHKNSNDSKGEINYGLFSGTKDLNVIGDRMKPVNVYELFEKEPDMMNFFLWLVTTLGTGIGLLSSTIAAIAAVYKAASAAKKPGAIFLLIAANISSLSAQVVAFICWLIQFLQYLQHNVLIKEDRQLWHSKGLATLGFSFYLIMASTFVVLMNIAILIYAKKSERRDRRNLEEPVDEKNQANIMLY